MIKKLAILGSTGSIGQTTCEIIKNAPEMFLIILIVLNKLVSDVTLNFLNILAF